METYVAFLRGINVGGNNIIKMVDLKSAFEDMKFKNVKTFIQSGNVIFQTNIAETQKIEATLEAALSKRFNYNARVLVRSKKEMEDTIKSFPKIFKDETWKHNVIFISHLLDNSDTVSKFQIKHDIEKIGYAKGVLFWSAKMEKISNSTMLKLSSKKEYKEMSVRNLNTTRKIVELMKAYE